MQRTRRCHPTRAFQRATRLAVQVVGAGERSAHGWPKASRSMISAWPKCVSLVTHTCAALMAHPCSRRRRRPARRRAPCAAATRRRAGRPGGRRPRDCASVVREHLLYQRAGGLADDPDVLGGSERAQLDARVVVGAAVPLDQRGGRFRQVEDLAGAVVDRGDPPELGFGRARSSPGARGASGCSR